MNTWTILKVCCSIPSLLCFAVFVEKPTSCLSQLPVHCSKLSPIGAFSLLCCVYYVDTEFNLLFLDCSSPQWKWRRDPRQQTIYWVFWSGWWSWRGVLSHVKVVEWGQKKKKKKSGSEGLKSLLHLFRHRPIHQKCSSSEKCWVHRTCLAFVAGGFCSYANLIWTSV